MRRWLAWTLIGWAAAGAAAPAWAQATMPPPPLPPVNLGQTNILDGEGQPGALMELITVGSLANRLADAKGGDVPGRNHQRVGAALLHPIYVSSTSVAGALPGVEAFLPVAYVDNDFAMMGGRHAGLGDITVTPFLQWGSAPKAGAVSVRLGLPIIAPAGDYVPGRAVNTGQGGWQIAPYLAATWRITDKWEISARAIYDWSGSAESRTSAGMPDRVRPGDLVVLNYSASYAVADRFRAGVGGYALRQLSLSSEAGASVPGSRAQVFALGPVTRLEFGKYALLFAAFGEFEARNRPEGVTLNLRFQAAF